MAFCKQPLPAQGVKGLYSSVPGVSRRNHPSLCGFLGTSPSRCQGSQTPPVPALPLPRSGSRSSVLGAGAFCLFASVGIYTLESLWLLFLAQTCPWPDCGISSYGWV